MTPLTKPVVRKTAYKVRAKEIVVTIAPGSVALHRHGTQERFNVDWETLWKWMEMSSFPPIKSARR